MHLTLSYRPKKRSGGVSRCAIVTQKEKKVEIYIVKGRRVGTGYICLYPSNKAGKQKAVCFCLDAKKDSWALDHLDRSEDDDGNFQREGGRPSKGGKENCG